MKKRLLASVGLVALMAAGSAKAADAPLLKAPLAAPAWSWSGFYLGGHAGYGWGRDPQEDLIFGDKSVGGINAKGGVWGFQAGANWQSGAVVGGLELDLSTTDIQGSFSNSTSETLNAGFITTATSLRDKFDLLGSARARLGFLPVPDVLIYGTAGPAWTRLNQTLDTSFSVFDRSGPTNFSGNISVFAPVWRFGLAAGAGIEARLGDSNWLARVEYLHYDFGSSGNLDALQAGNFSGGVVTLDAVRAGLSYKFTQGRPGSAYAAAMPVEAMPAAPWTWTGFYIGAHGGYGWGRDPTDDSDFGTISSHGAIGGLQAGANWQSGAFVGGLEIDASASDIEKLVTDTNGDTLADKFDWLSSARARLGYLVLPGTLVYGTGGAAWTRFVQTNDTDAQPFWEFGWVAGVGIETRLGATNWLGRVEYLHYDFGDSGSSFETGSSSKSGDLTVDVVRAGLSYKLDWTGAGPAQVAMPLKARPMSAASAWDGFYIGGHGGYGWGRDPQHDTVFGSKVLETPTVLRSDLDSQGWVAGFQAGANWQMGSFVAGLETDLSATGIKGSTTDRFASATNVETNQDKFDMLGSARARLGYLAMPNLLLYGTGGAAWTRLNQIRTNFATDGSFAGNSTPSWEFGWVAGAGGETMLWNSNWLLRLEYLHYDFGDSGGFSESFVGTVTGQPATGSASQSSGRLTADVVRTGLSYKFR